MDTLPTETMYHILGYISPECEIDSQAAALRVCWLWHDIIQHITRPARNDWYVTYVASENGHDRLLCWLLHAGYRVHPDVAQRAVLIGNMRVIKCMFRHCREHMARLFVDDYVVKHCDLNVVKYFLSRFRNERPINFFDVRAHCQDTFGMYTRAIHTENMPVVKMFAQNDHGLTFATCQLAVELGSSAVFEWALNERHACNIYAIIQALDDKTPDIQQRFMALLAKYHPNHEGVIAARGRIVSNILSRADTKYSSTNYSPIGLTPGVGSSHYFNFSPVCNTLTQSYITLTMPQIENQQPMYIAPMYWYTPCVIYNDANTITYEQNVPTNTGDQSVRRRNRKPRDRKPCEKQSRRRE